MIRYSVLSDELGAVNSLSEEYCYSKANLVTGYLGKIFVSWPVIVGNEFKYLMFHMSAHENVTSAEEDFNNQVKRMSHSFGTNQLISSVNYVFTKNVALVAMKKL
jgi:hypothetical protein